MDQSTIYTTKSTKQIETFIIDLAETLDRNGFMIHNRDTMDLANSFKKHAIEVKDGFDLRMIQVCKPEKAAKSLGANPYRATLMPKFIMVFSEGPVTIVQFLRYGQEEIARLIDDQDFPASLAETYKKIVEMIDESC